MTPLLKHSALGSFIRYCAKGNFDFSREHPKPISVAASSDDTTSAEEPKGDSASTLVDWDGPDDPSNPVNWPLRHKAIITTFICVYTFAVYVGSSIYAPSQQRVIEVFGISHSEGALGLALYVLGYGLGCLLFSPLSEVPAIGRNPPYAISGFLFVILCIPTSLVENYPGLMVLRFLLGFMASPFLATAGATLGDIWHMAQVPFAIALWAMTATLGPAFGPTISSYAVEAKGWQFSSWELLMISGPFYILVTCFVPETSPQTILYYRAKRLREETGNQALMSAAEEKQKNLAVGALLWDALIKPWEMNARDPALLFTTFYTGLAYGIFYSYFESFPLVYPVHYDFSATSVGLVFLVALPCAGLAFTLHCLYLRFRVLPRLMNGTFGELENHLIPGVVAAPLMPIGLFIFAWTARPSVHWIVPTIGVGMIMGATYEVMQTIFLYIPMIYPRYAASIFAANSLSRSLFAFAGILIARPMFERIGIDGGVSLLAGLMIVCMCCMFGLWKWGLALRKRSKFAVA